MIYFLGTDLGSTTSKSVILDENEKIVGKGLTNTRSNYEAATKVAEQEAIIDTRITFFAEELRKESNLSGEKVGDLINRFEFFFRYEHYRDNVLMLREKIEEEVQSLPQSIREDVRRVAREIFDELVEASLAFFSEMSHDKSMFFRDLVGSQYMKLAEKHTVYFETLMSIFDKCVLMIENHVPEYNITGMAKRSLESLLKSGDVESVKEQVEKAFNVATRREMRIVSKVGTGYGRLHLPYPKEQIQSEILCHGLGAHYMFHNTRTILDIGGQDTKAIQVDENGIVTSFHMNDRCAAGCGRFLGYTADELNLGLHELGPLSLQATKNTKISSTCTVFSSIEIRDRLSLGEKREDIVAGLHKAIVKRAMSLIARSGGIKNEFTFTGGVAKNIAMVKYVKEMISENYGDSITVNISPDSIFTGAIGAALFAKRRYSGGVVKEAV